MLLIGNGCFGELSIILRVPWYVYFFHSISNNIFTGINRPGVSCKYDTYRILLNMYVQVFLFASMVCCVVWSGGISSVSSVIELSYFFFFYLLLCSCRCLLFLFPVVRCMFHISLVFRCVGLCHFFFFTVYNNIH